MGELVAIGLEYLSIRRETDTLSGGESQRVKIVKHLGSSLTDVIIAKFEADDAIAAATARFKKVKSVEQIVICSVDKDLTQMVDGQRGVCWDRRREIILDEKGVTKKFGVDPESIPNDPNKLGLGIGRATTLLGNLQQNYKDALLFRKLSTLRTDVPFKIKRKPWRPQADWACTSNLRGTEKIFQAS